MISTTNNNCRYFFIKPELADKKNIDAKTQKIIRYTDDNIPTNLSQWVCKINNTDCKIYNSIKSGFTISDFQITESRVYNNKFYTNIPTQEKSYIYYKILFEIKLNILENQTNANSHCFKTSIKDNNSCVSFDINNDQNNQFELSFKQVKKVNINGLDYDLDTRNPYIDVKSFTTKSKTSSNTNMIQDNIRVSVYIPICYKNAYINTCTDNFNSEDN